MNWLATDARLARDSYYAATSPWPPLSEAEQAWAAEDAVMDVAVVGAGLAGLSAAIELADRGLSVVVLEAGRAGGGASGRNGGQALHGLACELDTIEAQLGLDAARQVWRMTLEGLDLIQQRCERFGIDAQWQPGFLLLARPSYRQHKAAALRAWAERMARVHGHATRWIGPGDLGGWIDSPAFHAGLHDPLCGHLHPLRYAQGLARAARSLGVRVLEHCAVTRLAPGAPVAGLHTARGVVRARQVLLAGNAALPELLAGLDGARVASLHGGRPAGPPGGRIMPVGTYIITTPPLPEGPLRALIPSRSAVCDTNVVLDYFRPTADGRLLFGGGVSYSTRTPGRVAEGLRRRMARTFPALAEVPVAHAWGGFVDITMNRAPDFGRLCWPGAASVPVYYLQGFSGHGLALTGLAGRLAAEAMAGDAGRFDVWAGLRHGAFPGGRWLRTPALVLGMAYYRWRDLW